MLKGFNVVRKKGICTMKRKGEGVVVALSPEALAMAGWPRSAKADVGVNAKARAIAVMRSRYGDYDALSLALPGASGWGTPLAMARCEGFLAFLRRAILSLRIARRIARTSSWWERLSARFGKHFRSLFYRCIAHELRLLDTPGRCGASYHVGS